VPFTPYLQPTEYADYGVPDATAAQVAAATRQVNAYIGRPEGLLWSPDANGMPCYMTNLDPVRSYTATVAAGSNVIVTVPNAVFGPQTVGEVVVIDRANTQLTEACVVTAASGNSLRLATVQFAHTAAKMEFGLTILEETHLRAGSPIIFTAKAPVAQILSGFSRPSFGKLPRQITDAVSASGGPLLATATTSTAWTQMDTSQWDINYSTGAVTVLPYLQRTALIDVRLRYVAGWLQANLPSGIKQAVAGMVRTAIDFEFGGNIKTMKSGDATIERFGASSIDRDAQAMLQPYRVLMLA
jgi:hypothetical protein